MKKIILANLILALTTTTTVFAEDAFFTADPSKGPKGIIIVPLSDMNPSEEMITSLEQQKTKGFYQKDSGDAQEMLKSSKNFNLEINNTSDPTDTHLKSDINKIKLAFKYNNISFIRPYGYAAGGMYIKDSGWTAIGTFFNDKELGVCSYTISNMKLSHGAVRIAKEFLTYDINNKVTTMFVEGSLRSGFMYALNWYDSTNSYDLECANMTYDKSIKSKMIALAKKLDKQQ